MTKSQDNIAVEIEIVKNELRDIAREIRKVRRNVRADLVGFPLDGLLIDDDLTSIAEVKELSLDSGFLMDRGTPVFVYIRDHMIGGYQGPQKAKKIHFCKCKTLQEKMQQGEFQQRYRKTNRDDNRYLIDIPKDGGGSKEKNVALYPCENCLESVSYQCFPPKRQGEIRRSPEEREEIERIKRNFDAKVAFALIRQQFEIFTQDIKKSKLSPANTPAGYPSFWKEIAREQRELKNHTCELCKVCLRHAPECLEVHHMDSNKQNILNSNLVCLCKCCHARQHEHYNLSDRDHCKILIDREQRRQKVQRTCS